MNWLTFWPDFAVGCAIAAMVSAVRTVRKIRADIARRKFDEEVPPYRRKYNDTIDFVVPAGYWDMTPKEQRLWMNDKLRMFDEWHEQAERERLESEQDSTASQDADTEC